MYTVRSQQLDKPPVHKYVQAWDVHLAQQPFPRLNYRYQPKVHCSDLAANGSPSVNFGRGMLATGIQTANMQRHYVANHNNQEAPLRPGIHVPRTLV